MNIRIRSTQKKKRLATARVREHLRTLLRSCGIPDAELSVLFVGDRAMRTLNRTWRGRDRSTDVLSFAFREGPGSSIQPGMLGDIVIAVPVATRQARKAGLTLANEIDRLLVHGLLHLLGYDHEKGPREERRMRNREEALLRTIDE